MTRTLIIALLLAVPTAAAAQPAPGRYCAPGLPDVTIGPAPGMLGIDLMDCRGAAYRAGQVSAPHCYGMGGAETSYDTDLAIEPGGDLTHDGARYRLQPPGRLCP
ncbi:hypothetical protein FV226_13215 [Methylobacterium sp. WL12]|uniref:hypothetical protein n=1 Tax=Methylobacterium sp. WL12 TaxID=2603890 RepID=UPI0011C75287|nr:hypothetical protein [Methylobacterium sp. WL12]TXM72183.1 hypothetical protein FV226_13215 [Methylobacterium sp. WL12]